MKRIILYGTLAILLAVYFVVQHARALVVPPQEATGAERWLDPEAFQLVESDNTVATSTLSWAEWTYLTTLDAYNTVGHRDPAWDTYAVQSLAWWAQRLSTNFNISPRRLLESAEAAMERGCEDPLIRYVAAGLSCHINDLEKHQLAHEFLLIAQDMSNSDYPPFRKAWSYVVGMESIAAAARGHAGRREDYALLENAFLGLFPGLLRDPNIPTEYKTNVCLDYLTACRKRYGTRTPGLERLKGAIGDREFDAHPALLAVRGWHSRETAWEGRGGGFASQVSREGWNIFTKNIKDAMNHYLKAWERAREDDARFKSFVAAKLVELEAVSGGDMEFWYLRAVEHNPDNWDAHFMKLFFLTPKWGGSEEEMFTFARGLVAEGNWHTRTPFILVEAHLELANYVRRSHNRSYYLKPGVWEDISEVYQSYLERYPDMDQQRSAYTEFAILAQQWQVAAEQLEILGDRAWSSRLGDARARAKLMQKVQEGLRREAEMSASGDVGPILTREQAGMLISGQRKDTLAWLAEGGDPNARDTAGESAMVLAVNSGDDEILMSLIRHGGNVNTVDRGGRPLLMHAQLQYLGHMVQQLLDADADVHVSDPETGHTPLTVAADRGDVYTTALLLDRGADINRRGAERVTALHLAARKGYLELINLLVERGADLELRQNTQYTPLMVAVQYGRLDATKHLVALGAELDAKTSANTTPLAIAVWRGNAEIMRYLIDAGANVDVVININNDSLLMGAVQGGHVEAAALLLDSGADVSLRNKRGKTALNLSKDSGNEAMIRLLTSRTD